MVIPYQTTKFKIRQSANIFAMAIWGPNTKFNSHQYLDVYVADDLYLHILVQLHA